MSELVVVDQFEELFTLCDDADRGGRSSTRCSRCAVPVVIGVRADLYGELSAHAELARAVAGKPGPARRDDRATSSSARSPSRPGSPACGSSPGSSTLVLRDVAGEPGALPLLSHALRATWERRDGRTLTVEGYRESGGVASAIARTADAVVDVAARRRSGGSCATCSCG